MKKLLTASFLVIFALILTGCSTSQQTQEKVEGVSSVNEETGKLILFVGDGCPHCENVEKYMEENGTAEKLDIETKEVYYNRENQKLLQEKAGQCGINTSQIGVPLLWDENGKKCMSGDADIINFLKEKSL